MKLLNQIEPPHKSDLDEKFHQLNIHNIRDTLIWYEKLNEISGIKGCIVECGVGRGRSLLIIAALNKLLSKEEGGARNIFAYDSFEGFPEPTKEDVSYRKPHKGEWSKSPSGKYTYTPEFIKLVLTEADVLFEDCNFTIKKGFFNDTLKTFPEEPIALLHIDADLYQSYKDVLLNLYNKVVVGGIVVFDDFFADESNNERWPGARVAVTEFLGEEVKKLKVSSKGSFYLIKE